METASRHQCLIYEGAPSLHLRAIAAVTREKLKERYRCLYLNSRPMVAGMRSYLAASGVDVTYEIAKGNLVLSSDQSHLVDGRFEIDRMIDSLVDSVHKALRDGYVGLWASGDMTWEFGPDRDFSKLVEYEWRLEELFHRQPALSGICQYHTETLPPEATRQGFLVHPSIFVNETLSLMNPHYMRRDSFTPGADRQPGLDAAIVRLCNSGSIG